MQYNIHLCCGSKIEWGIKRMEIRCDKCDELMELTDTDSRQEWVEETYECFKCKKIKIHRTEFDQIGLVISDVIRDE